MTEILRSRSLLETPTTSKGGEIDTSLLLEELRREYSKGGIPLEVDFRQLVGWVRLGDQLTHQIHPYPAKLLPLIAHFFVNASSLFAGGKNILDPFCGSGTVALEASVRDRQALVADANPFALLLAKVKTTPYDCAALLTQAAQILKKARRYRAAPIIDLINPELWYTDSRKKELERLLRAVDEADIAVRDFFLICFSAVARRLSLADLTISVPVRLKQRVGLRAETNAKIAERIEWLASADCFDEFERVCFDNIERVARSNFLRPGRHAAVSVGNDVRKLKLPESIQSQGVNVVLTSPPYGSAQKYVRATSLSLNWLGLASPEQLRDVEAMTIGREHITTRSRYQFDRLPDWLEKFLREIGKANLSREEITRHYLCEMRDAINGIAQATLNNGHVILVVGNNHVCGQLLETDRFLTDAMVSAGFSLEMHLIDRIKSRGLMTKRNSTASVISGESILVFKKIGGHYASRG